jgi:hypothetical protein
MTAAPSAPPEPEAPAAAPTEASAGSIAVRLRDGIPFAVMVFAAVWIGWSLLGLLSVGVIPVGQPVGVPGLDATPITPGWHNLFDGGNRADALWYQRIAADGYHPEDASAAFFPLYPMLVHAVSWLGVGTLQAALFVAQASLLGSLVVMYALTTREFGDSAGRRATRYLAVFPTAFFLLSPFTESLFLFVVLLAFWFARDGRWWQAAIPATLASLTRSAGIVLVGALLVEAAMQWHAQGRPFGPRWLAPRLLGIAAPAIGLVLYMAYWSVLRGDAAAPVRAQKNWGKEWTWPQETIWHAITSAWQYQSYWLIDLLVTAIPVVAVLAGIRFLRPSYSVYALGSVMLPLVNQFPPRPLMSVPRYVVVLFPAFMALAVFAERRKLPNSLVIGVFSGLFALLGMLFVNAYSIF